jgi:acyl-CoA synthetase (NDP forming)
MTTRRSLARLLRPQSIAVAGGSWAASVIEQCRKAGFDGELWAVHPTREQLAGAPCFVSVDQLPASPDAVFIGVNRHATVNMVRQLAAMGAGGAVCFASGFQEAAAEDESGIELQQQLLQAAGDMPVLGPNCYGLINYLDGAPLWPDQHGGSRVESGVAIITQSSNIALNLTMQQRGLPIAYIMTAGNQAQTGLAEMGMALLEDSRVTALGLYIEGFGNVRAIEQLAAVARHLGKGIVALKAGRSDQSREAMMSHTSSLSGSDAASAALLARLSIARVDSLPSLLESLKLLHVLGPLSGNRLASMSCSGGEAGLMADSAIGRDVVFPALNDTQRAGLREALGPMVALANPLDYHTYIWNDPVALAACFTAMLQSENDLTFLIIDLPRLDRCTAASWIVAVDALVAAREKTGSHAALLASLPENMPEELARQSMQQGVLVCCGIDETLSAVEAACTIGRGYAKPAAKALLLPAASEHPASLLDEYRSKALLAEAGVLVPKRVPLASIDQIDEALAALQFPVVLKGLGVAHKTDMAAVNLNLADRAAVHAAAVAMQPVANSFLLEEHIDGAVAELLIGVVKDPVCGFVLTIAAGGILTEVLTDAASLLLPARDDEIRATVERLRVAPLLHGYRGGRAADINAIVATIAAVCRWIETCAEQIEEVEINPLLCLPDRAVAVDALIRMREQS